MKWFKHTSTARNDERISRLEDKAGLEGYGFYFKMLEIVAENVDATDRCEVTYSISRWGRQANITTKKFLTLVQRCADVDLMLVQRCADDVTVQIPNLLKYRDNHTKNLQAACKQEKDKEKDKEGEGEKEEKPCSPPDETGSEKQPSCPHEEIIALYHSILPGLPSVRVWGEDNKKNLRARWREDKQRQDVEWWRAFFQEIKGYPFLVGEKTDFQATLGWIVGPKNFTKILNGAYRDNRANTASRPLSDAGMKTAAAAQRFIEKRRGQQ